MLIKNKRIVIIGLILIVIIGGFALFKNLHRDGTSNNRTQNSVSVSSAIPSDVVSFDNAALVEEIGANLLLDHVYETLIQYDTDKKQFQPVLAEKWEISGDGLRYTFKLRAGIKFHDQTELNAETIVENITRIKNPEVSPVLSQFLGGIKETKAIDSRTLVLTLDKPSSSFLSKISFIGIASLASIKNESLSEKPIGTGPLIFISHEPGDKIVFQRNDQYWGQKPPFKEITIRVIPDENARLLALRNGDIDFLPTNQVSPENKQDILKNTNFSLTQVPANSLDSIYFNEKDPLLSKTEMRKALTKAIDPQAITRILDKSVIESRGPIPVSYPENPSSLKTIAYDLEQAKQMISQLNPENRSLEIAYLSDNSSYQKIAEYIAEQWSKAGLQPTLKKSDTTTMINNVMAGEFDTAIIYLGGPYPDPLFFLEYVFSSSGPYAQFLGYQNNRLDEIITELQATQSTPERNKKLTEAQQLVINDAPAIFLYNSTFGYIFNKNKIDNIKVDYYLPSKHLETIELK